MLGLCMSFFRRSLSIRPFSTTHHCFKSKTTMSLSLDYTSDRAEELKENMQSVLDEINQASSSTSGSSVARLVPISKIKPASDIKALYDAGYRHFGENYIQEMVDKAEVVSSAPLESAKQGED